MVDITRALYRGHPTWPGDTPFRLEPTSRIAKGAAVNVMALTTSTHVGTHLDAPYHYDEAGVRLGGVALERLSGPAQVLFALAGLEGALLEPFPKLPERVLFFTGQPEVWEAFPERFHPFSPEIIHLLADRGVRLIGTDAPSVDPLNSKDLPAHRACAERDVLILEGLNLQGVSEGRYELLCLPLNLPDADASPVRAVLRRP
jgi:arylformamidase